MKLVVIVGSLRAAAFSRKLAHAVVASLPEGVEVETIDGRDLPLFDQDLEAAGNPPPVVALHEIIAAADGLVFVSPEFNFGIPGTLKNLIDWASRPPMKSPLRDKPSLVIALSVAPVGGARAHLQLSNVLSAVLSRVFPSPGFAVGAVHEKFDEQDALVDESTQRRLGRTLQDFVEWAKGAA